MTQHPCHASLPEGAIQEAIAQLSFFAADRMLNPEDSVVPYSKETSKEMLELLTSMSSTTDIYPNSKNGPVLTLFVSRLMERIVDEHRRQQYGHYKSRVYLKRGRHARKYKEVMLPWPVEMFLAFLMTFVCFGAPYSYLRRINEFFTSALGRTETISEKWRQFVDDNISDWTDTNLVATVLVSGAVALIAIPGIDSVTRILGFLSILCALASLISGLLNSWQHQHESHGSMELTVILDFFSQAQKPLHTFKILALILALPMTLLSWATIMFALAVVVLAWRGIDPSFVQNDETVHDFSEAGRFRFGAATAWVTTGSLFALTAGVVASGLFFWNVWTPPRTKKHHHKPMTVL